jgi:ubiquinone/menaquinone biosynthesis C-methylase UbiE
VTARDGLSATYGDVDRSPDPAEAAAWMDTVATYEAIAAAKERTLERLGSCERVLDVGCGVGNDVRALGPRAVGVDPSRTMLREAHSRGGNYALATGHQLPFGEATFDGVRADRVLQHVVDPESVVAELVRVVAPGGRLIVTDPDQATLAIEGPDPELTAVVVGFRRESIRNPYLAGTMDDVLRRAGCVSVGAERFAMVVTEVPLAFGIATWSAMIVDAGLFDPDEAAAFDASLAAAGAAGTFAYCVDLVVTHARRGR